MTTYDEIDNVGTAERVLRGVVGIGLVEAVLLVPALSSTLIAVFAGAALYAVFTAIMGWDPVYAVAKRPRRRGEPGQASVTAYRGRPGAGATGHYKKAA